MSQKINLVGQRFGKLLVLEPATSTRKGNARWRCACDCGRFHIAIGTRLRADKVTQCGLCVDVPTGEGSRGGKGRSACRSIWTNMLRRCNNPKDAAYHRYGGRGIAVCDAWQGENGFDTFIHDMGPRPSEAYSIDRIDNDLGYSPENCRWATRAQQAENRSDNKLAVYVEYEGRTQALSEWAVEKGIPYGILRGRFSAGWALPEIFGDVLRPLNGGNATGFRGVGYYPKRGPKPYKAKARLASAGKDPKYPSRNRYKSIGWFKTAEEAAIARDVAVLDDNKPLAMLNFHINDLVSLSPKAMSIARERGLV